VLSRRRGDRGGLVRLGHAPAIALVLSAVALAACAFVTGHWGALLLAFAMGAQNGAVTRFGDTTLNTCSSPATCRSCSRRCCAGCGSRRAGNRRRLAILAPVWLEYFAGALLGALAHAALAYPLLIPAA